MYITPITGSGILSGFQIILQNFSETCSFLFMMKNVPKGRFFKLPGKKIHKALVYSLEYSLDFLRIRTLSKKLINFCIL